MKTPQVQVGVVKVLDHAEVTLTLAGVTSCLHLMKVLEGPHGDDTGGLDRHPALPAAAKMEAILRDDDGRPRRRHGGGHKRRR